MDRADGEEALTQIGADLPPLHHNIRPLICYRGHMDGHPQVLALPQAHAHQRHLRPSR